MKRRPTSPVTKGARWCRFWAASVSGVWPRAIAITFVLPKKILLFIRVSGFKFFLLYMGLPVLYILTGYQQIPSAHPSNTYCACCPPRKRIGSRICRRIRGYSRTGVGPVPCAIFWPFWSPGRAWRVLIGALSLVIWSTRVFIWLERVWVERTGKWCRLFLRTFFLFFFLIRIDRRSEEFWCGGYLIIWLSYRYLI